jgi:hypothetical protein
MDRVWNDLVGQFSSLGCKEEEGKTTSCQSSVQCCSQRLGSAQAHAGEAGSSAKAAPYLPRRPPARCRGTVPALPGSRLPHFSANAFTPVPELPMVLGDPDRSWPAPTRSTDLC